MHNVSKGVTLAVDVLVLCLILVMCIYTYRTYKRTAQVAAQNMNETTTEYQDAAISEMLGNAYTGAEVKNYIKKYRRKLKVEVQTLRNPTGAVYDAVTVYTAHNTDNPEFFENQDVFVCDAGKDTNGNYARLVFKQSGTMVSENVSTPEEAQTALAQRLGLTEDASWQSILDTVDERKNDSAKHLLVNVLGGSYNFGSSWDSIAEEVLKRLSRYQALLDATSDATRHNASGRITLGYNESYSLDFTPDVLIVYFSSDGASKAYTRLHGAWVGENPGLRVESSGSGIIITHSNSTKQSVNMVVEAFN